MLLPPRQQGAAAIGGDVLADGHSHSGIACLFAHGVAFRIDSKAKITVFPIVGISRPPLAMV